MSKQPPKVPEYLKFCFGGTAAMFATLFVHPLDFLKTRMQVAGAGSTQKQYKNTWHAITSIAGSEGPLALYGGLGAGLLRQGLYSTTRLGIYTYLNDAYIERYKERPTVLASLLFALTGGGIGAFIGTPADVVLIRMAADGRLPPNERRNYKNVFNALVRIPKEEGVTALWKGCVATVGRAMVVNMAQLASYSQLKNMFRTKYGMNDGLGLHFITSMLSGLIVAITSMPVDIAKTRIQNQKTAEYKGTIDVIIKVAKNEGILALWKGFTPYYCRVGPNTVITLVILERIYKLYYKYVLKDEGSDSSL